MSLDVDDVVSYFGEALKCRATKVKISQNMYKVIHVDGTLQPVFMELHGSAGHVCILHVNVPHQVLCVMDLGDVCLRLWSNSQPAASSWLSLRRRNTEAEMKGWGWGGSAVNS